MAAHRQSDGVYLWDLSIPPAAAVALLRAVCVDLDDPNSHYVGHWLLGPKTWTIQFDNCNFELRPLGQGSLYTIFGLTGGRIVSTKAGSCVELRPSDNEHSRRFFWWLPLLPRMAQRAYTDFLDNVFGDYIAPPLAKQDPSQTGINAAATK